MKMEITMDEALKEALIAAYRMVGAEHNAAAKRAINDLVDAAAQRGATLVPLNNLGEITTYIHELEQDAELGINL